MNEYVTLFYDLLLPVLKTYFSCTFAPGATATCPTLLVAKSANFLQMSRPEPSVTLDFGRMGFRPSRPHKES